MSNYKEKTVFVGIDVHKKTYAVTAICDGIVLKRDVLRANPKVLITYLKKRYGSGKIITAYESGFCGFHLHRALEEAGIENIVVHAASIEVSNSRVKTDARDSLKIAQHLSHGKLKCIYIPTAEREDQRAVTRLRETFSKQRTRLANQIKALLFLHGLIADDNRKKVSEKWIKNLSKLELTPGVKYAIEKLTDMWLEYNLKIKEIDSQLKAQATQDNEIDIVYQSTPGVGPISARILANELGDLSQFNNERQLFSYLGLTPSEHSSGDAIRQGHITKQGKPTFRRLLVQAAWTAIRYDKALRETFERIAVRAGAKRAIIGVSRRLIGRIRACFRNKKLYEYNLIEKLAA